MKKTILLFTTIVSAFIANAQNNPFPVLSVDSIQFVNDGKLTRTPPNDSSDYVNPVKKNTTYGDTVGFEGLVLFSPKAYGLSINRRGAIIQRKGGGPWSGLLIMCESTGILPSITLPNLIAETKFYDSLVVGNKVKVTGVMRQFNGSGVTYGETQVYMIRNSSLYNNSIKSISLTPDTIVVTRITIDSLMTGNVASGNVVQKKLTGEKWEGVYVEFRDVTVASRTFASNRWTWSVIDNNGNQIDIRDFSAYYRNDANGDTSLHIIPSSFAPPAIGAPISYLKGIVMEASAGTPATTRYWLAPLVPSDLGPICSSYTLSPSLPDTTIAFKTDSILLDGGTGFTKYLWSTGDTTRTAWVKNNSKVYLTVTNSLFACGKDSTVVIFVKGIQQKDTSICAGSNLKLSIPSRTIPSNGLVAWYPFNGNANDASGNGKNGTIYGGVTLTTDRFGNPNNSYNFNGTTGAILADTFYVSNNFTASFWYLASSSINLSASNTQANSGSTILCKGASNNPCNYADFAFGFKNGYYGTGEQNCTSNSWLETELGWGCNYTYVSNCNSNISLQYNWTNLTIVLSSSYLKRYSNGVLIDSISYTAHSGLLANSGYPLSIGGRYVANCSQGGSCIFNFWMGKLDDIGIWNRALNQTEIQALYNGGNANTKITWSTSDTTNSISVTPTINTTYSCTQRIGSFTMTDSVRVNVRNLPIKAISYNKKGLCLNDTITISSTNGYAYNWFKNNNATSGSSNTLKVFANGNYKVKLTDSTGCSNISDSVSIFNAPLPKVNMSLPDTALCVNGNVFKYTDSTQVDSGTYNRIWTFGNGNTSILSTSNQSYTAAGNYVAKLKVITNYGCADSVLKNIIVKPNPVAGALIGQTNVLVAATPYVYTVAQQLNHTYNWIVTNGIISAGQGTNNATIQWISNGNGYIKVEVTNPQGCLDTTAVATKIGNVGINETSAINNLSLYPNPNYGSFTVGFTLKESSATKLELNNMLGQQVWVTNIQLQNGEQQIPINLSLSTGVYLLRITTSTSEITKQVLVK